MSKNILIDASNSDQTRIAVTENAKLDDFEIESNKKNAVKGDVYLAGSDMGIAGRMSNIKDGSIIIYSGYCDVGFGDW